MVQGWVLKLDGRKDYTYIFTSLSKGEHYECHNISLIRRTCHFASRHRYFHITFLTFQISQNIFDHLLKF